MAARRSGRPDEFAVPGERQDGDRGMPGVPVNRKRSANISSVWFGRQGILRRELKLDERIFDV
jgi:hypothetical protein